MVPMFVMVTVEPEFATEIPDPAAMFKVVWVLLFVPPVWKTGPAMLTFPAEGLDTVTEPEDWKLMVLWLLVFVPFVWKVGEVTVPVFAIVTTPPEAERLMPEPATRFNTSCLALFVPPVWKTGPAI